MSKIVSKRLDTFLAIVGIIVSIIAGFDIVGIFENIFANDVVKYFNLILGVSILFIVLLKKQRSKTDFVKIRYDEIPRYLTSSKVTSKFNKVVIFNPEKIPSLSMLVEFFNTSNLGLSIIGDANNLLNIFNDLGSDKLLSLSKFFHVLSFGQESSIVLLYNDKNSPDLSIVYINKKNTFIITVKDELLATDLNEVLYNEEELFTKTINLDQISKPADFLNIINQEKKRYITNFKNLRSGYISFYGTEVSSIQCGWVESGSFKTIRTLDLTSDPGILLTRHKYIEANKNFIEKGGSIKRIYLISKEKLDDPIFHNNLIAAINLQKEIGVRIGLKFLDDLQPKQKQDFILFDTFASFVEEKQANSDYSFGKSTAYFSIDKIEEYEEIFNDVWHGQGIQCSAEESLQQNLIGIKINS